MVDYSALETVRLDIWLWRARFVKTRTLAGQLIKGGKVRITRAGQTQRARKANATIRAGDVITLHRPHGLIVAKMLAPGERRGPAAEAQTLYQLMPETEPVNSRNSDSTAQGALLTKPATRATSGA